MLQGRLYSILEAYMILLISLFPINSFFLPLLRIFIPSTVFAYNFRWQDH
jgi:hypothetical protein